MPQLPALVSNVSVSADTPAPSATRAYPHATLAWQLHKQLTGKVRKANPREFTDRELAGMKGYLWRPDSADLSLRAIVKELCTADSQTFTDTRYEGILKHLRDTANGIRMPGSPARRPEWWIAAEFQGVEPSSLYRADQLAAAAAEADEKRLAALHAAELQVDGLVNFDPDKLSCDIGLCAFMPGGSTTEAAAAVHKHQEQKHPGDYWADAEYGCPACHWPAASEAFFRAHLAGVHHRQPSNAEWHALAAQGKRLAAAGRARHAPLQPAQLAPARLAPVATPGPAPAPRPVGADDHATAARIAKLESENTDLRRQLKELQDRLGATASMLWDALGNLENEQAPLAAVHG